MNIRMSRMHSFHHPLEKPLMAHTKLRHHAIRMRRDLTAALAFTTTLVLLCMEHVKAFTASSSPISTTASLLNENSVLMMASGAHSLALKWRMTQLSVNRKGTSNAAVRVVDAGASSKSRLAMAFGFDSSSPSAPPLLDMKTSISAFGGWYNTMDPVARPPIYEEYVLNCFSGSACVPECTGLS